MAAEEKKIGFFDETFTLPCGINVRKHLHWREIDSLARVMANVLLIVDEKAGTMVKGYATPFAETLLFLTYCTDCDLKRFEYPEPVEGEDESYGGAINPDALMDWAMENSVDKDKFDEWCESWIPAWDMAHDYASVIRDQYRQANSLEHKLLMAFGDILDGTSEEVVKGAAGLGETLIDLIGKTKEAAKPQGGVVNFAKKK